MLIIFKGVLKPYNGNKIVFLNQIYTLGIRDHKLSIQVLKLVFMCTVYLHK